MKDKIALISVSDKTGLCELARTLICHGYEIIGTKGTCTHLKEFGVEALDISALTGFPEMLGGRIKSLNPKIYGGILANRELTEHLKEMRDFQLPDIRIVVVDLHPFESVCRQPSQKLAEIVEAIDIGGVTLIRAAAKNFESVTVVSSPDQYDAIKEALGQNGGVIPRSYRLTLAIEGFKMTSKYDRIISSWLEENVDTGLINGSDDMASI